MRSTDWNSSSLLRCGRLSKVGSQTPLLSHYVGQYRMVTIEISRLPRLWLSAMRAGVLLAAILVRFNSFAIRACTLSTIERFVK